MTGENLIHIRVEYGEAIQGKRDVLSTEASLLKTIKKIKKYNSLRQEELRLKLRLHRKLSELKTSFNRLQTTLPRIQLKEIPEQRTKEEKTQKIEDDVEIQLQEIQEKLRSLQ